MSSKRLNQGANAQQQALNFICTKGSGSIDELKKNIDEKTIREFELVGFIKRGVTSEIETWKISKSARSFYNSIYGTPSFIDKMKGYFCHYALGI